VRLFASREVILYSCVYCLNGIFLHHKKYCLEIYVESESRLLSQANKSKHGIDLSALLDEMSESLSNRRRAAFRGWHDLKAISVRGHLPGARGSVAKCRGDP